MHNQAHPIRCLEHGTARTGRRVNVVNAVNAVTSSVAEAEEFEGASRVGRCGDLHHRYVSCCRFQLWHLLCVRVCWCTRARLREVPPCLDGSSVPLAPAKAHGLHDAVDTGTTAHAPRIRRGAPHARAPHATLTFSMRMRGAPHARAPHATLTFSVVAFTILRASSGRLTTAWRGAGKAP